MGIGDTVRCVPQHHTLKDVEAEDVAAEEEVEEVGVVGVDEREHGLLDLGHLSRLEGVGLPDEAEGEIAAPVRKQLEIQPVAAAAAVDATKERIDGEEGRAIQNRSLVHRLVKIT